MGDTATFGVDLGGTNLRVARGRSRRHASSTSAGSPTPPTLDGIVDEIADAVRTLRAAAPGCPRAGRRRRGHGRPRGRHPLLAQRARVPRRAGAGAARGRGSACPSVVDNDANVAVVAELVHGAARGLHRGAARSRSAPAIGGGDRHRGEVLRGRARVRRRDRALPGRSRRAAVRVRAARPLGGAGVGHRARRARRERAAAGAGAVGARARRRRRRRRSRACTWATSRRPVTPDAIAIVRRSTRRRVAHRPGRAGEHPRSRAGRGVGRPGRARRRAARRRCALAFDGRIEGAALPARRCRSSPPSSAGDAGCGRRRGAGPGARVTARCRVKLGLTLPSFRDDAGPSLAVAHGGRGERARRCVRVRPPVPPRPAGRPSARDRDVRADGRGRRRDAARSRSARSSRARRCARPRCWRTASTRWRASSGPERLLVAIGAGDGQSQEENETFGLEFGTVAERVAALRDAVDATARPWVPGVGRRHRPRRARGGGGARRRVEPVGQRRRAVPRAGREPARRPRRAPPFTVSWGGLVVLADDDDAAAAKAERLGAGDHVIVGGPELVAERAARLRRRRRRVADGRPGRLVRPRQRADPRRGDSAPAPLRAAVPWRWTPER